MSSSAPTGLRFHAKGRHMSRVELCNTPWPRFPEQHSVTHSYRASESYTRHASIERPGRCMHEAHRAALPSPTTPTANNNVLAAVVSRLPWHSGGCSSGCPCLRHNHPVLDVWNRPDLHARASTHRRQLWFVSCDLCSVPGI